MVVTILEAKVEQDQWPVLEEVYRAGSAEPPIQMVESFLLQAAADPTRWQIISVWKSREALEEMRQSAETPAGVLMFRAVGAEPTLLVLREAAHIPAQK